MSESKVHRPKEYDPNLASGADPHALMASSLGLDEALDEGDGDAAVAASIAKAAASEAYLQTAIHAVQIHGGIGFTWDNDTHLWFKRAKASEVMLGDANLHRERMMQAMVESA